MALAYMVLNVNIKLFFVEIYIIQLELYIGIYMFKHCVHLFKGTNHCQVVYKEDIYVHFIPTERTQPKTDSLVF